MCGTSTHLLEIIMAAVKQPTFNALNADPLASVRLVPAQATEDKPHVPLYIHGYAAAAATAMTTKSVYAGFRDGWRSIK